MVTWDAWDGIAYVVMVSSMGIAVVTASLTLAFNEIGLGGVANETALVTLLWVAISLLHFRPVYRALGRVEDWVEGYRRKSDA